MSTTILPNEIRQPSVAELVTQFNDFVQFDDNASLVMKSMYYQLSEPNNPFSIANTCTILEGVTRPEVLAGLSSSEVLQPSNSKVFNSKGDLKFYGRTLTPNGWKIDILINPQDVWFAAKRALSQMQMGLIPTEVNNLALYNFMIEEILSRGTNDLRQIIFKGAKGTGTDAIKITDGFNKLFADGVTAGTLTPLPIVANSVSNVLDSIDSLVKVMGPKWKRQPDTYVAVASNVYQMVAKVASGLGTTQPTIVINNGNRQDIANNILGIPLPTFPNIRIYEEPYLPADAMYATVKRNMVVGFDTANVATQLRAEPNFREVAILGDGMVGVQVRQFDAPNGSNEETAFVCNEAAAGV